jgi:hypothetical protein
MKKSITLATALFAMNCHATELHHFVDIQSAATAGKSIHIAVHLAKCTTTKKEYAPELIGVFTPREMIVMHEKIATSFTHFTLNAPGLQNIPVYQHVRNIFTADDMLTLTSINLDARNYAPLSDEVTYQCKLDAGVKVFTE